MPDLMQHQMFIRDLTAQGVTAPEQATLALAVQRAALEAATATPSDDLRRDLLAGTLTPASAGEQVLAAASRTVAKEKALEVVRDLEHPLRAMIGDAVRADGDRLVRQLGKPFTAAAKAVHRAAALFPADADSTAVLSRGPEAAAAWQELHAARQTLDSIHGLRLTLARDYGHGPMHPAVLMFTSDPATEQALHTAMQAYDDSTSTGGRWHALACAGFRLHLTTRAEQQQAQDAIAAAGAAAQDRELRERVAHLARQNRHWLSTEPSPAA